MARKSRHPEHANHERWLISYADFITLLFAFFVVMFASSQTDKSKAKQISAAVEKALEKGGVPAAVHEILGGTVDDKGKGNAQMKGPGGAQKQTTPVKTEIPQTKIAVTELMPSMQYLNQTLAQEIKSGKLEVRLDARGLIISLRQAAFFPSGGDDVAPAGYKSMETIATAIRDLPNPVRLEGHTDAIPIHTERYRSNWELSVARSIAMLEIFATRYDLPRSRFSVAGYAETKPIDSNDTAEGRAHNRRVDIVILNQTVVVKQENIEPDAKQPAQPAQKPRALKPKANQTSVGPNGNRIALTTHSAMATVQTKFFGALTYGDDALFRFPTGLPGFEDYHDFVFLNLPGYEPLIFLQSIDISSLCFILLPVRVIDASFTLQLTSDETEVLGLPAEPPPVIGNDILCAALICAGEGQDPTANLLAPVIVNLHNNTGIQALQTESGYSHAHVVALGDVLSPC